VNVAAHGRAIKVLFHLFWKVNPGLDPGKQIQANTSKAQDLLPQGPAQLGGENFKSAGAARIDKIDHGFGLGQIDPAV